MPVPYRSPHEQQPGPLRRGPQEYDRGGPQQEQRQKDNQGGQVAGNNDGRSEESNDVSAADQQPQAMQDEEDPNVAVLLEVKDQLSDQQFEWMKQALSEGDKKVCATVGAFKKSKDAVDFVNTVQRFYRKAFGPRG